jgi:hypothetical protein
VHKAKLSTLLMICVLLFSGCSNSQPDLQISPEAGTGDSLKPAEPTSRELSFVTSIPYSSTVQEFPTMLKDYRILKDGIRGKMRLFYPENYANDFPELQKYTGFSNGANACSAYYWMIRWRSQNPDVELAAGSSSIPVEPGESIKWEDNQPAAGGAGYMEGRSCTTPYIFFYQAINGSGANLVDVNYEILIWENYPDI